jgi:geranylgeranyl diphosphate synthase type II
MGVESAGGGDELIASAERYAESLGLAFQIRDDVLDIVSDEKTLGKPVHADAYNVKSTFASLLGVSECERLIREETQRAVDALTPWFGGDELLVWLARKLSERKV